MKEIKGICIEKIKRSENIESFRFKTGEELDFKPGQFIQVIFDENNRSNKELNKYLSLSCAPGKNYIEFTKKLSISEFSQSLKKLQPGDTLLFKGPLGNCVFNGEYDKIGFLIGGIGITPVISIIENITHTKLPTDVNLIYANRNDTVIAFKGELDQWAKKNKKLKIWHIVNDCRLKDSACLKGEITRELIETRIPDHKERIIYIYGPPAMVSLMKNLCMQMGCLKEKVHIENFVGY